MATTRLPKLPQLLDRKIYKTGQTRGADDDVIYQNRVSRSSTVLIPYKCWPQCSKPQDGTNCYENGFIVLISPTEYFSNPDITLDLSNQALTLGTNAIVFYETREQWEAHNPQRAGWQPARNRTNPLGGEYIARIPATTATHHGGRIIQGFDVTSNKGAGIRVYEYANSATIENCRLQLEALFWLCADSDKVAVFNEMAAEGMAVRKEVILAKCRKSGLLDIDLLIQTRILNSGRHTICPFCLEELSSQGFFNRMEQAQGRDVPDLTITQLNLFHINELRYGVLNHRPYNVGWGHHHCNVVVKDSGILQTLEWIRDVLNRNIQAGHLPSEKRAS
jgi:hypothetical protein